MDGPARPQWPLIVAFSALWGLALVTLASVEMRYGAALAAGLVVFTMPFLLSDSRRYFLTLITLTLFVGSNKMFASVTNVWPYDLIERMTINGTDVLLLGGCVVWLFSGIGAQRAPGLKGKHLFLPMLGLLAAVLLSFQNATYPMHGVFELFRMVKVFLLYVFLVYNIRRREEIRLIVAILGLNIMVQLAITLLQKYGGSNLGLAYFGEATASMESMIGVERVFRAGGTLGHPNHFAYCLDLLIPLFLSMSFSSSLSRRQRAFFTAALAAALLCLYMTLSRGGLVGTGVALAIAAPLILHRNMRLGRFSVRTGALVLVLLVAACAAAPLIYQRFSQSDAGAFRARIDQWQVATNIISAHPWVGIGLNNYRNVAPSYDDTASHIATVFTYPVHNVYLLAWAETGVVGLMGLLVLMIAALRMAYFGRCPYGEQHDLQFGLFFGFVAYLIHSNVDINPPGSYAFFYFLLAVLTASQHLATPGPRSTR
ncbi:MAG: O-antigen ligase family protein [Elusimicrobiota bacterium]